MTEEYMDERERDLFDYLRNNFTDPEGRAIRSTKAYTATASQTKFIIPGSKVVSVADTIDVDGTTYRKGYHYTVTYGEGEKGVTILNLTASGPTLAGGETVTVVYDHGSSAIEREFSRTDVTLPRVVMMFLTASEEPAALGDHIESGTGSYVNASYRIEIRDKYATRARRTLSQIFNICRRLRHSNLFRTNLTFAGDVQNFDYDIEKAAYVWQFDLDVQWEVIFG